MSALRPTHDGRLQWEQEKHQRRASVQSWLCFLSAVLWCVFAQIPVRWALVVAVFGLGWVLEAVAILLIFALRQGWTVPGEPGRKGRTAR